MTSAGRGTDRPFTVIVCAACSSGAGRSVVDDLRPVVRQCPRAMLVTAACMLGPLTCASRPAGAGVMAVVQPCTIDRVASGPCQWIGPISDDDEIATLRAWLTAGRWEDTPIPERIGRLQFWSRHRGRSN